MYVTGYNGATRTLSQLLSWSHWQNLDTEMARRTLALMDASIVAGRPLGIGSIFRSFAQQENLFFSRHREVTSGGCCSYKGKRYALRAGQAHAAPPNLSYHEATTRLAKALAVDFVGDLQFLRENAARYGLIEFSQVNGEPWHGQPTSNEIPRGRSRYRMNIHDPLQAFTLPGLPDPAPTQIRVPLPILRQGSAQVAEVRDLQYGCNFWGWRDSFNMTLVVDGNYGPKTDQAVRAMQRDLGQVVDGAYGHRTATALQVFIDEAVDAPPFAPEWGVWGTYPKDPKATVRSGSSGDLVKYLQGVLRLKASQRPVTIDGQFGSTTEGAVRNLQSFFGLHVDGVVGQQTWPTVDFLAVW